MNRQMDKWMADGPTHRWWMDKAQMDNGWVVKIDLSAEPQGPAPIPCPVGSA